MFEQINQIIQNCIDPMKANISPTLIFNEGWLLRLVLNWFSENKQNNLNHPLSFSNDCFWYSEALLPSPFLARYRGDPLSETFTHADGVIGHFKIGDKGKGDINLNENATILKVVEAKLYSELSSGITNNKTYNQASRNIACLLYVAYKKGIEISNFKELSFLVIASKSIIESKKSFTEFMNINSINSVINKRVEQYINETNNQEQYKWFEFYKNSISKVMIKLLTWEEVIEYIKAQDKNYGERLEHFYNECSKYYPEKFKAKENNI